MGMRTTVATIKKKKETNVPKNVKKLESFCSTGGNISIKWYRDCEKQHNGTMVTQNFLNRIIIWSSNSTPEYITQRTESRVSRRYLYIHVHSSSIHNCWNVEANQIFAEGWMNKQNVVFTYNGMLFSLKNKENSDTFYNIHKPENTINEIRSDRKTNTIWSHLNMEPQNKTKSNSLASIL